MSLESILEPVKNELKAVQVALDGVAGQFGYPSSREIARKFFDAPGKLLRPALVLLSARAVSKRVDAGLIQACLGVELIHSASLIHDDIIDGDAVRRGQPTVHQLWGTKIALLMGDALYSHAFALLTESLPKELLLAVVRMNEGMCAAEIEHAYAADLPRDSYFRIIEGKTAAFMSVCCLVGARLSGATDVQAAALQRFGLEYGMAFQLFDDTADSDLPTASVDGPAEAALSLTEARRALSSLPAGSARSSLEGLCDYLEAGSVFAQARRIP